MQGRKQGILPSYDAGLITLCICRIIENSKTKMIIAIFGKSIGNEFLPHMERIVRCLKGRNVTLICEELFARFLAERLDITDWFAATFDKYNLRERQPVMLLSVGGDGTFLDAMVYVKGSDIPMLGVNSGRLGFLATVSASEIDEAVDCICSGRYGIEVRDVLGLKVDGQVVTDFDYALNEVSVQKAETSSLLNIHAYIGGTYLTTYWADGLIVATPTGSTAYSLSGGGPIVSPDCKNIILTPVCPHNLSMRPLVVPNHANIRLCVEGRSGNFMLCMDSRMQKIEDKHELDIFTGDIKVNVVKLEHHNYYGTLRNKLMWGEDMRNEKFGSRSGGMEYKI